MTMKSQKICVYHKKGDHAKHYELKPQFRRVHNNCGGRLLFCGVRGLISRADMRVPVWSEPCSES